MRSSLMAVAALVSMLAAPREVLGDRPQPGIEAAGGCKTRIPAAGIERRRCLACVANGGAFHTPPNNAGICAGRPSAARASAVSGAASSEVQTLRECEAKFMDQRQRRACMVCIRRGGAYRQWGMAGFCLPGQASPPASQALAAGPEIRSLAACQAREPAGDRRRQCKACVRARGVYVSGSPGRCRDWIPATDGPRKPGKNRNKRPRLIYSEVECKSAVRLAAKRRLCVTCILDGKLFYRPGEGRCIKRGDPLPASPGAKNRGGPGAWRKKDAPDIRTPAGCRQQVEPGEQRRRCLRCVKGGGTHRRGKCVD